MKLGATAGADDNSTLTLDATDLAALDTNSGDFHFGLYNSDTN